MSTAETTASNSMFRNGSICAMKSIPGRTTQNNRLLYLYRKGDVIMKTVSFRSNSTIKDHDAPECWVCQWRRYLALNVCSRWTASDPARAHAMWFCCSFFFGIETKVDVSKYHPCHAKCHACHAKCSYMSPSATPATQKAAAPTATPENQARRRSQPDAIRATPATQSGSRCVQVPATWNEGGCLKVPRLPRKVQLLPRKVQLHVAKCCACHSKCSYMSPSATPVTQKATAPTATPENQARYQSQPSATSATPATQSAATCRQVPRLPRKKPRRPRRHLRTKRATGASPMPYVPYVPHLPRKVEVDVSKYHACHVKRRWMSQSAAPATQSAATATQSARTKHAAGASPMPYVPRLPRKLEVDVSKYHACHVKRRWMSQSATPATQSAATCPQVPRLPRTCVWASCVWVSCVWTSCVCVWVSCVWTSCVWTSCVWTSCVWVSCVWTSCVWASCVWVSCVWASCVCGQVVCVWVSFVWASCVWTSCVWVSCVWASCVWTSCVWASCVGVWTSCVCVSKFCVSKLCVDKLCLSKLCVSKPCVDKLCVSKLCVCVSCVWVSCVWTSYVWARDDAGRRRTAGYRTKNKNPTQRCGEKCSKPPTRFFWIYKDVCDILWYDLRVRLNAEMSDNPNYGHWPSQRLRVVWCPCHATKSPRWAPRNLQNGFPWERSTHAESRNVAGTDDLSIHHSWAIPSLLSGDGNTMSEPHVCQQHWAVIWKHSMEACLYSWFQLNP